MATVLYSSENAIVWAATFALPPRGQPSLLVVEPAACTRRSSRSQSGEPPQISFRKAQLCVYGIMFSWSKQKLYYEYVYNVYALI